MGEAWFLIIHNFQEIKFSNQFVFNIRQKLSLRL